MRGDREHLVAVDDLALLVDRDHAIGVAVERETDVGPVCRARACWSVLGVRGAALLVDVGAVGRRVQHVDVGTERAQRGGRGAERRAVPAVDDDLHAVEATALERVDEVRDVVVDRTAVLGRDPDLRARRARRRASLSRGRAARARRAASSGSGILRPPGANSLTPLSS